MADLKISEMPTDTFANAELIPAVDLTQPAGSQNVVLTAAELAPVREVNGQTGAVTLTTASLPDFETAVGTAVAAAESSLTGSLAAQATALSEFETSTGASLSAESSALSAFETSTNSSLSADAAAIAALDTEVDALTAPPVRFCVPFQGTITAATSEVPSVDVPLPAACTIPANLASALFAFVRFAATAETDFPLSIRHAGTVTALGSISVTGTTVSAATTLHSASAGDVLSIGYPETADETLGGVAFTFAFPVAA
jgi:hypothetical protein